LKKGGMHSQASYWFSIGFNGTADTTATTDSASISKDNNSQHARSIGNAGVSREVINEGRKHHDISYASTAGTSGAS
jgi:hypothetical protein